MLLRLFAMVLVMNFLSGCASYIASRIETPNRTSIVNTGSSFISLGIYEDSFCSAKNAQCMPYLFSTSAPCRKSDTINFKGNVSNSPFGSFNKVVDFDMKDLPEYRGLVVMAHGFQSDSKSYVLMSLLFNCLGFDVVAVDLMGHGHSTQSLGYGVNDSELLTEFLAQVPETAGPVILVGHSMGALAVVRAASASNNVTGLYLLSPMDRFDTAAVGVAESTMPFLSSFVPDSQIRKGATLALQRANIDLSETDMLSLLQEVTVPTLIYGSSEDAISVLHHQNSLTAPDNVEVVYGEKENHISVLFFDDEQLKHFLYWLENIMPANAQKERSSTRPLNGVLLAD